MGAGLGRQWHGGRRRRRRVRRRVPAPCRAVGENERLGPERSGPALDILKSQGFQQHRLGLGPGGEAAAGRDVSRERARGAESAQPRLERLDCIERARNPERGVRCFLYRQRIRGGPLRRALGLRRPPRLGGDRGLDALLQRRRRRFRRLDLRSRVFSRPGETGGEHQRGDHHGSGHNRDLGQEPVGQYAVRGGLYPFPDAHAQSSELRRQMARRSPIWSQPSPRTRRTM